MMLLIVMLLVLIMAGGGDALAHSFGMFLFIMLWVMLRTETLSGMSMYPFNVGKNTFKAAHWQPLAAVRDAVAQWEIARRGGLGFVLASVLELSLSGCYVLALAALAFRYASTGIKIPPFLGDGFRDTGLLLLAILCVHQALAWASHWWVEGRETADNPWVSSVAEGESLVSAFFAVCPGATVPEWFMPPMLKLALSVGVWAFHQGKTPIVSINYLVAALLAYLGCALLLGAWRLVGLRRFRKQAPGTFVPLLKMVRTAILLRDNQLGWWRKPFL